MGKLVAIAVAFRAGWRPFAGWVSALILLTNGVILPLARLHGIQIEPLDWRAMAVFVGAIIGLGSMRSFEKHTGSENNEHD